MVVEPLISIIMPTHDRANLLQERSIPSVCRQTHQNWELLIRGDGADKSTELVIRSFNDPRIKYQNLPRHLYATRREQWSCGGAHASNAALQDARGTYIAYLDDDDEFLPRHLATLSKMLMFGGYDFVYGRVYFETDRAWKVFGEPFDKKQLMRGNLMSHCAVMYDRAKLGHLRYDTNGTDPADWRMWKKMVAAQARVGYTREIVAVHYRERSTLHRTQSGKTDVDPFMIKLKQIRDIVAEPSRPIEQRLLELEAELLVLEAELDAIRHSFGYKLMKSWATKFDRWLPEGTSRDDLRKLVTVSLRVLSEEGPAVFCVKAFKRVKSKRIRSGH